MAAYFILTQTVTDQTAYSEQYIPGVLPFLAKYGAEVLKELRLRITTNANAVLAPEFE